MQCGPINIPPRMMPTMPGKRTRSESRGVIRMMLMMSRKNTTGSCEAFDHVWCSRFEPITTLVRFWMW